MRRIASASSGAMVTWRLAKNIRQVTIAPLLAEAMRRISDESSVSSLFD